MPFLVQPSTRYGVDLSGFGAIDPALMKRVMAGSLKTAVDAITATPAYQAKMAVLDQQTQADLQTLATDPPSLSDAAIGRLSAAIAKMQVGTQRDQYATWLRAEQRRRADPDIDFATYTANVQALSNDALQSGFAIRESMTPVEGGRSWATNRPVWVAEFNRRQIVPITPTPMLAPGSSAMPAWLKYTAIGTGALAILFMFKKYI